VAVPPDPWASKVAEAAVRGRKLYHGLAQCLGCHPAYAARPEIDAASRELSGSPVLDFRNDMYGAALRDSDYGVKILAPDFTRSNLRSIRPARRAEDLFRVIAVGVGGTAMPSWKGMLPDEDLWALVHYIDSLIDLKDGPGVAELHARIEAADATWKPAAEGAAR
jgi:mono/diheme cytochrome c family protein